MKKFNIIIILGILLITLFLSACSLPQTQKDGSQTCSIEQLHTDNSCE